MRARVAAENALDAGEARAVFQHDLFRHQILLRQPRPQRPDALVPGGGSAVSGGAEIEEQHLGHDVVAVLVDVPDQGGQGRGIELQQQACVRAGRAGSDTTRVLAAGLLPQGAEQHGHGGFGGQQVEGMDLFAARLGVTSRQDQPAFFHRHAELLAPTVARRVGGLQAIIQGQGIVGFDPGLDAILHGPEAQIQRVEIGQQRGRRRVVGAQGRLVEGGRVDGFQFVETVVENHVAMNLADAPGANLPQQQPEPLLGQAGIAAPLQDQVAGKDAILDVPPPPRPGS
jgi:hypothetical protein